MTATTIDEVTDNPYRLPRTVIPRRYELELAPDLEQFSFSGHETISVDVTESIDTITLNAIEIEIHEAAVTIDGEHHAASVSYDEEMQRASLHLDAPIGPGEAEIELAFTGTLNDQLHGFYRSSFTDVDGNEQTIATTQFEATDARRAFPCWDEPDFKAVFAITLVVPEHLLAVSNMAEVAREPVGDGRVRLTFADSILMSTYILAFVVGPFEATDPIEVDGVPLRIIAPRGKEHLTEFALECGAFCLRYLSDYYGIPYPGDKVDMIAVPDFAFGAMENLGAITYRETALLVDRDQATQAELVRVLDVIAHELAHMWFGDLVTMKWWDGIWLNEAFATLMEMKATDAMRPEWKRWLSFGALERPWAFGTDSLASTRPVEFEVTSPEEANEMFDALTYGKGSSVLRMMEQYIGEDAFRDGVGSYLRTHSYANTVTADLWAGLNEASGVDVGAIMDTWILQRGYPQVEVSISGSTLRLEQRRYLIIPDETDTTLWQIPVAIRGEISGRPFDRKVLLDGPSMQIELDAAPDFVVVNAGGHGFYRVNYNGELFSALIERLDDLDDLERYCLIDDAAAFIESGGVTAVEWLELAAAYRDEEEQAVWSAIVSGLATIKHHIVEDEQLPAFNAIAADLLKRAMERLGWEPADGESDLTRRLRGAVVGAMGRIADDPDTVERSRSVATRWIEDPGSVDPDVGQAALFTFAKHGDRSTFDTLMDAHLGAATPQTELKLLQAITFIDDTEVVDSTLDAVRDGRIKSQDSSWVVARLFGLREAGAHAWAQVRKDWDAVTATMPPATLKRMVEGLPGLSRPEVAQDVEAFFAEREHPLIATSARQNLERLRANVAMRERESERLNRHLAG